MQVNFSKKVDDLYAQLLPYVDNMGRLKKDCPPEAIELKKQYKKLVRQEMYGQ